MSAITQAWGIASAIPAGADQRENWYALLTRARHEKIVELRLRERGVTVFLPLVTEVRRWSDRRKLVEFPLFSCYVFAKLPPTNEGQRTALRINGVFTVVGMRGAGAPIPDEQIDAIRRLIKERLPWHSHPFLKIGQRVRIRGGALDGVEGVLVSRSGESALVLSIDAIQRSLAVRIEGYNFEPA